VKTLREKKQEEQEITTLQSRASANSPNWAILNKLKEAMLKLKERNVSDGSEHIGKLVRCRQIGVRYSPSTVAYLENLKNVEKSGNLTFFPGKIDFFV